MVNRVGAQATWLLYMDSDINLKLYSLPGFCLSVPSLTLCLYALPKFKSNYKGYILNGVIEKEANSFIWGPKVFMSNINSILYIKKDQQRDLTWPNLYLSMILGKHRTIKTKWIIFPGIRIRSRITLVMKEQGDTSYCWTDIFCFRDSLKLMFTLKGGLKIVLLASELKNSSWIFL